ncbi:MAG: LamG domain-containing protein [Bacteroidota bacterium]
MKTYVLPLITISIFVTSFTSLPDGGLVAHYTFDDCMAADMMGKSPGIEYGQPDCGCGVIGSAMYFDGIDDHVTFDGPINDAFGKNDFTISFYFKTYANTTRQIFLSNREECDYETPYLELKHLQPCGGGPTGRVYADATESKSKRMISVGELPETRWRHVTYVRTGEEYIIYMNGEEVDRRKAHKGVADLTNAGPLSIAYSPCIAATAEEQRARYFPMIGAMDELRVYNRALTGEEVLLLYQIAPVDTAEVDCAS